MFWSVLDRGGVFLKCFRDGGGNCFGLAVYSLTVHAQHGSLVAASDSEDHLVAEVWVMVKLQKKTF